MKTTIAFAALLVLSPAVADDFRPATILDVHQEHGVSGSTFPGAGPLSGNVFVTVVVSLGDTKVTAQTYDFGGGGGYLINHAESVVVGSEVPARIDRNMLELKLGPNAKLVKLRIGRLEK